MHDAGASPGTARILARIGALAAISDEPDRLTRLPLGPGQQRAAELILGWMREAGMSCYRDGAGNLIGDYPPDRRPGRPVLALGSHYDTVRDAGRFDGTLGILTAIETVQDLHDRGVAPEFDLRVLAFEDEEGVCFGSSLLGSHAYSGQLTHDEMSARGDDGLTLADRLEGAGSSPEAALASEGQAPDAYVELHIEQGPVLEDSGRPVGVVTSIAGQTRLSVRLCGEAGHAGTVPMRMRHDAMAGAAECILAVERIAARHGVVGTVGQVDCQPGAINVIPGEVRFSIDMRSGHEPSLTAARQDLDRSLSSIASHRGLALYVTRISLVDPTLCNDGLQEQLARAVGNDAPRLASGAGHDAVSMACLTPVGMLFVACRGGISHDPAEDVAAEDIAAALAALQRFVRDFDPVRV